MSANPHAMLVAGEPPQYIPKLVIPNVDGKIYKQIDKIAFLAGDDKCTRIFMADPLTFISCVEPLAVGYNLGYFAPLLEHRFARVNQSYIVRLQYVVSITRDSVKLAIKDHPVLLLTDKYRKDFYYKMEKAA